MLVRSWMRSSPLLGLAACAGCASAASDSTPDAPSSAAKAGAGNQSGSTSGMAGTSGNGVTVAGGAGVSSAGAGGAVGNGGASSSAGSGGSSTAVGGGAGGAAPSTGGVTFDANRIAVTGVRGTVTPAAATSFKLHNGTASAVQVTGVALGGPNAVSFRISAAPAFPATLAAGGDLPLTIEMMTTGNALPPDPANKDTGCVMLTGTLSASFDSGTALASVYGLLLAKVNYEATLGQVLTALGYEVNVGKAQNNWNSNTSMDAATLPGVEAGTDEVAAPRFAKAGAGPVGMSLVARFSPVGPLPFGWYTSTTGCPGGCMPFATMAMVKDAQTSDKARMVKPPAGTGGTNFDPGSGPFGIWIYSDQASHKFDTGNAANGDYDYSQDALNTPANAHRFKTYPLQDASGMPIAQSYLVAVEEAGNGDYQDYVFVLSNVQPMP